MGQSPHAWTDKAECLRAPLEVFFPEIVGDVTDRPYQQAKRFCEVCVVRQQCLDEAMQIEKELPYRFGVFGGLNPRERANLSDTYDYK
jgi:hypothetical protein